MGKLIAAFLVVLFLTGSDAYAKSFLVETLQGFDVKNPPPEYSVRAVRNVYIGKKYKIERNSVIKGEIAKVILARRLHRDSCVVFIPKTYTVPSKGGVEVAFSKLKKTKIKYKKDLNEAEVATNTGVMAACQFVPVLNFIVPVVQFGAGMVNHKDDENPFHGGCRSIVESWPICYCLKGDNISFAEGTVLKLSLSRKMFEN